MASSINKLLGKSTGLQAVLDKQKLLQECMVKTNPCRNNVSSSLLKWSMTESNLSLFDAFSSWSDLDHALLQLTQAVIDQNFAFRQTFKNIQGEEKRIAELQRDTEAASKKVKQISLRLESARSKSKKVDQVKVDNFEAELTLAKGKEREMMSILDAKEKEFEICKGKWVKETLCLLSKCYVDCLEKSLKVWNVKHQIATDMADDPVYHGENLKTDSHLKVSGMYTKLSMTLPPREESMNMKKRTLPAKPPPDNSPVMRKTDSMMSNSNRHTGTDAYETKVDASSENSDADEDYAFPDPLPDSGENYLVPGFAEDFTPHPSPPSPPASPSEDTGGSETSDGSLTIQDKTTSLGRGIKVLPAGGTMKGSNPLLPGTKNEPVPVQRINKRGTPPPSPPSRTDLAEKSSKSLPSRQQDKRQTGKKPAILPKPSMKNSVGSSKESLDNINEDEHEYSDVPIEADEDCRYPRPNQNGSQTIAQNNNITQVVETDSDSEDYENVAIGAIS